MAIDINCVTTPAFARHIRTFLRMFRQCRRRDAESLFIRSGLSQPFTHQARLQFEREVFANTNFQSNTRCLRTGFDQNAQRKFERAVTTNISVLTERQIQAKLLRFKDFQIRVRFRLFNASVCLKARRNLSIKA